MVRKRDDVIWDEFKQTNDGVRKCKHCRVEFSGNPSVTRLRKHLLGIQGGGIRSCGQVPDYVKNALADASSSSKRPRIEPSSSINNSEFHNGKQTQYAVQRIEEWFEGSDTSALDRWDNTRVLRDRMTEIDACRIWRDPSINDVVQGIDQDLLADAFQENAAIGSDPSINEKNNVASTSAPQQNNEFGKEAHDGERTRVDQEPSVVPETNGLPETNGEPFPVADMVGEAFQENMDIVLKWLTSGEVSSVGIYGMGGVGKTTLLTHIHNKILKDKSKFGHVYWITVSQDFSIEKLQNLIAKTIGLDFGDEEDLRKRAATLEKKLRECKVVLILDDLWNHFDIKMVGIHVGMKGSKLIIASRSRKVCSWTNCQKEIKVLPLLNEDAWQLFIQTLGHALAPEVEQIARSVVGECSGLPLGIVTMAGSMRRVDNIHEWNNALTELKNSEVREDDMEPEVFRILRYSYARLSDPRLQQCLLYCALYPEDFEIRRDELIEHLVVERIIERTNSRKASHDKGQTMLNKLVNVCLLEQTEDYDGSRAVKMHDLIRDMAIQIMGECSASWVKAGKQLTSLPESKWWMEDTARVSLMMNSIKKIPTNCSPNCPKLSTLFLCNNYQLKSIPELFFFQLHSLKVLNLSDTMIQKVPESVAVLENLTALFLRSCMNLRYVPPLRKLGALEVLDLYDCGKLEKVPEGLESLSNLIYLNLLLSGVTKLPSGILRNLSHLQFLAFQYSSETGGVNGEEVGYLSNLETLYLIFNDQGHLNNYILSLLSMHAESQQLSEYTLLLVGPNPMNKTVTRSMSDNHEYGQDLYFRGCTMSREVLLPKHIQKLYIIDVSVEDGRSLCLENAINLKEFTIYWCKEIKYLFSLSSSPSIFQSLETLYVSYMEKLSWLFSREEDDGVIPIQLLPNGTFSCLKEFTLYSCHNMKKLFPSSLLSNLRNLEELEVYYCSKMDEIIASEEEEGGGGRSNTLFILPNLRLLALKGLRKLKSICVAELKCDSLRDIVVSKCPDLKKIPISLPLSSLEKIEAYPREWWESVEWAHSNNKFDLLPKVSFRE